MRYNYDDGGFVDYGYGGDLEDSSVLDQMYNYENLGGNNFNDGSGYLNLSPSVDYITPNEQTALYGEQPEDFYNNSPDYLGALGKLGSGALNFIGNNGKDLAQLGIGALGMYGNYQAGQAGQALNKDQVALQRELGLGNLELNRDKFRLGEGIDPMASKALGMQLLINRGRMTADQTNPWLNMMFTGRQQMFGNDPKVSNAFANNPFTGYSVGAANTMPSSANQFFRELEPSRINRAHGGLAYAEGGSCMCDEMAQGGALGLLRGGSTGQADDVQANLSHGEYVFRALVLII